MAQAEDDRLPKYRWLIRTGVILGLLLVLAISAFFLYRRHEPDRLADRAREYFDKGDYRQAVLTARRALQINPSNQSASRLMVEITEALQVPDALDWRRRLAELNPGSSPEALAFAGSALRMGNTAAASQALSSVPESQQNTGSYHASAGMVAMGNGRFEDAGKHFAEALKLEPENELHRYNLATFQIQSRDPEQRKTGLATLAKLAEGGRVQVFARRALIKRLIFDEKWEEALVQSTSLQGDSAVTFPDRLVHMDLLRRLEKPEMADAFLAAQRAALARPEDAAALMEWLRLADRVGDALAFSGTLTAELRESVPVRMALAECGVTAKDWPALRAVVESGKWGEAEYLRLAYFSRALAEQQEKDNADVQWSAATAASLRQRDGAQRLVYLASRWGWTEAMRETLWAAAGGHNPDWSLQMLNRLYQSESDTSGLLRVARRMVEVKPESDNARNNVAMLSLLLGHDAATSLETARLLHEKAPQNASYASTYALGLHLAGRSPDGLAILRKLSPSDLNKPEIAGYYALLLSATGGQAEAAPHYELAKRAQLLPEEQKLIFPQGKG